MSANTAISPGNHTRIERRPKSESIRVPVMRRRRPHEEVIKEQAGLALVALKRDGELYLSARTPKEQTKQLRNWLVENIVDMTEFDFGKNEHARADFLRRIVAFMTNRGSAGSYVLITARGRGGAIVSLTALGQEFLDKRARDAHPASGAVRVVSGGVAK